MKALARQFVGRGTSEDLLRATATGARIAAQKHRTGGLDEASIRRIVVGRFLAEFGDDPPGELSIETLVAVVQRSVDQVLGYATLEPMAVGRCERRERRTQQRRA